MKLRFLSLLLLAVAFSSTSFAQGIHAGLKGGVNIFKIDGQSFKDEFDYGYNLGAFAEIKLSPKVGIQPEILWNQQQTRTTDEFNDIYNDGIGELRDVKLNYLSIPLLLNLSPSKAVTFQVGPQFGILIDKEESLLRNGKDAFKTGDLSMLGGIQLNLGSAKVGGRYVIGLNDLNDIDDRDDWRNQGFQLYVGFRLL
jgi:hypothetical protein